MGQFPRHGLLLTLLRTMGKNLKVIALIIFTIRCTKDYYIFKTINCCILFLIFFPIVQTQLNLESGLKNTFGSELQILWDMKVTEHRILVLDWQKVPLRGSSTFAPKFQAYFQRWFSKKLNMILSNDFPCFISTFSTLKKITLKQLFFSKLRNWSVLDLASAKTSQSTLCHNFAIPVSWTKKTKKCL